MIDGMFNMERRVVDTVFKLLALCIITIAVQSDVTAQTMTFTPVFSGFTFPSHMVCQDDEIYVVELHGKIYRIPDIEKDSSVLFGTVPNVNDTIANGVYGVAFHPEYPDSNYLYVRYTYDTTFFDSRLSRFSIVDGQLDPFSEHIILSYDNLVWFHQGGNPMFGMDGYMYIPTGDGDLNTAPKINGQDPKTIRGNILRIDVSGDEFPEDPSKNYIIPKDNPYIEDTCILDEIFAYGFRNPWRLTQDEENGTIYIGEVGWNAREEVNILQKGGNYGWPCYEGNMERMYDCYDTTNLVFPYIENYHDSFGSMTGGFVYRGAQYPTWQGKYIYGDFKNHRVCIYDGVESSCWDQTNTNIDARVVSFVEDMNKEMYFASYDDGLVYKLDTTTFNCPDTTHVTALDSVTYTARFVSLNTDSMSNVFFTADEMDILKVDAYPELEIVLDGCEVRKNGRKY